MAFHEWGLPWRKRNRLRQAWLQGGADGPDGRKRGTARPNRDGRPMGEPAAASARLIVISTIFGFGMSRFAARIGPFWQIVADFDGYDMLNTR